MSMMNDTNRTAALIAINSLRARAVLGQLGNLPRGTHMNRLAWNCSLEEIAQRIVNGCVLFQTRGQAMDSIA
ncbi:hypothetical protein KIN20_010597 [Parelaphostrongylus tenuis]|uniref:SCP domain-containing protein n=1 Tax=Parelaphostrongylus tenuis TaxID=148309 RepID=A0AAD5MTL8_PARTN|nr:hypothetical protein KIN20_010597 [Parelaphostrongylus tenuis]